MPHVPIIIDSKKDADHFTTALLKAMDTGSTAEAKSFPPEQQEHVNSKMVALEAVVGATCPILEQITENVKVATQAVKDAMQG